MIPRLIRPLALALVLPFSLAAQADFTGAEYNQDFNSLPLAPDSVNAVFTFTNNVTLAGWFANVGLGTNNARTSAGAQNASGELYNWGRAGSLERALGPFFSAGFNNAPAYLALCLRNDSGKTISSVRIGYTVEQWRRNIHSAQWRFAYLVTPSLIEMLDSKQYKDKPEATVISPHTGKASGLSGDSDENRIERELILSDLDWQPGAYIWLRWGGSLPENAAGLGLDNVSVSLPRP